jgi:type I restriction enzyme R subunit
MEHAIRKHCTVHFDEDPAFYRRLSEKLEALIQQHKDNWQALATGYEQLRREAIEGRREAEAGLSREATAFYDFVVGLVFATDRVPPEQREPLKQVTARVVEDLQSAIGILDFWKKPIEVKQLRGRITDELLCANIPQLEGRHERLAVEIIKLAEKRHEQLTR